MVTVNEKLKSRLQAEYLKRKNKKLKIFHAFIIISALLCLAYCVYLIFSPDKAIVNVMGVPKKDFFSISFIAVTSLVLLGLISLFVRVFIGKKSSQNLSARINEKLSVKEKALLYSFRIKHETFPADRHVIYIPFDDEIAVHYNSTTREIYFKGKIYYEYVEMYDENVNKTSFQEELDEFVIYDYFEPQLKEVLVKQNVKIVEKESNDG